MTIRCIAALLALVLVAGCTPLRRSPDTRYQGIVLDARRLGAQELEREKDVDPTLRAYVAEHGQPDFIYVASPLDVELIYRADSRLVHFHRNAPQTASTVSEVSPLPTALLNVLPLDLRAGTPLEGTEVDQPALASCWRAPAGQGTCRTCCKTSLRCSTECSSG